MDKEITLNDLYKLMKSVDDNISKKVDKVSENLESLNKRVDHELKNLKEEVENLRTENNSLKERIKRCEKLQKKNNLIVNGIVEEDKENPDELLELIISILKEKLDIKLAKRDFSSCFRLGKISDRSRPILLELLSNFHKKEILQNRTKLRGTNIFINEDLIFEERQEKKILIEALKAARSQNKQAALRRNFVVIEGQKYSAGQIINKECPGQEENYFSPPPSRQALSEPTTPSPETYFTESIPPVVNATTRKQEDNREPADKQTQGQDKKRKDQTPNKSNPSKRVATYSTRLVKKV